MSAAYGDDGAIEASEEDVSNVIAAMRLQLVQLDVAVSTKNWMKVELANVRHSLDNFAKKLSRLDIWIINQRRSSLCYGIDDWVGRRQSRHATSDGQANAIDININNSVISPNASHATGTKRSKRLMASSQSQPGAATTPSSVSSVSVSLPSIITPSTNSSNNNANNVNVNGSGVSHHNGNGNGNGSGVVASARSSYIQPNKRIPKKVSSFPFFSVQLSPHRRVCAVPPTHSILFIDGIAYLCVWFHS
jgi:hypothetical protein